MTRITKPCDLRLAVARQDGAALVVGLILLLVLTLLAITGMSVATLELRMAGNEQYQERAFQAAEAGLERAISQGVYNTNVRIGTYNDTVNGPVPVRDPDDSVANSGGIVGCTEVLDEAGAVQGESDDCYEYFLRFDDEAGTTAVPGGGWTLGAGFEAYHFIAESYGSSSRGAQAEHSLSFYVVGPGGT
jgi:type IV pilus assembly protein PilX